MKIVCVDNFNRDTVNDYLLAENIKHADHARVMAEALNAKYGGENDAFFAVVKPDDYQLYKWEL